MVIDLIRRMHAGSKLHPRPGTAPEMGSSLLPALWVAVFLVLAAPVSAGVRVDLPPVETTTLKNGLTVIVVRRPEAPIVTAHMMMRGGEAREPVGKEGLAQLTGSLLRKGTDDRTALEISQAIDFVGGDLGVSVGNISTQVEVSTLVKDFDLGLDLLTDVILSPSFPENEIELEKRQLRAQLRSQKDNARQLMTVHLSNLFYGDAHPNGRLMTEPSLTRITRQDIVDFHRTYYAPNRATLLIVGDVTPADALKAAKKRFGSWERNVVAPLEVPQPVSKGKRQVRFVEKPGQTQVQVGLALPGLAYTDTRFPAAQLANHVLGAGIWSSRLFRAVRVEEGKTYHIGSGLSAWTYPGALSVSTSTRNEELYETLSLVLDELRQFRMGITEQELADAKANIIGGFPLSIETIDGLASLLAINALYGKSPEEAVAFPEVIRRTTLEEVNAAVKELIDFDSMAIVLVGDPDVLEGKETLFEEFAVTRIERVDWTDPAYKAPTPSTPEIRRSDDRQE